MTDAFACRIVGFDRIAEGKLRGRCAKYSLVVHSVFSTIQKGIIYTDETYGMREFIRM